MKRTGGVLSIFRVALLSLLVLALWNPSIPWTTQPIHLVVLLDDSLSMSRDLTDENWPLVAQAVTELSSESRFSLLRYGALPVLEVPPIHVTDEQFAPLVNAASPPRRLALDRSATDTEAALRAALRLLGPDRRPVILLITDGKESDGDVRTALELAKDAEVMVYLLHGSRGDKGRDVWIDDLYMPERVRKGDRISLLVTLKGTFAGEGRLKIYMNDALMSDTAVSFAQEGPTPVQLWMTLRDPGIHEVDVVLDAAGDELLANNSRKGLIAVEQRAPILFVTRDESSSAIVKSLSAGGWTVQTIRPGRFPHQGDELSANAAIVLDDIAVGDMSETAWADLTQAVRGEGTGLIVLGGPRSFGGGAYRRSALEALLPVTAESGEPQDLMAVLFVVDKSGSMGRDHYGASRLAYAREAVIKTSRALATDDLIGLVWFDTTLHEALPLQPYDDFVRKIERAWTNNPAGGTALTPALDAALDLLSGTEADRHILVLITDGFLSPSEDLGPLADKAGTARTTVISLVIGEIMDVDSLQQLSAANDGALLRVDRVAELPRIMRSEIEKRRNPVHSDTVIPRERASLPYLGRVREWPALTGYMVTKARPEASVYLESERGDPLLAMRHVGAARVVALPGGLGPWARTWRDWPLWGQFIGGLLDWVATRDRSPFLHIRVTDSPGRLEFTLDAVTPDFEWLSGETAKVTVQDQATRMVEIPLGEVAPGRYAARVPITVSGRYTTVLRIGDQGIRQEVLHTTNHEFVQRGWSESVLTELARDELLKIWRPGSPLLPVANEHDRAGLRQLLLPGIVMLYLLLLVTECIGPQVRQTFDRGVAWLSEASRRYIARS